MPVSALLVILACSVSGVTADTAIDVLAVEDVCSESTGSNCALNELQSAAKASKKSMDSHDSDRTHHEQCAIISVPKKHPLPFMRGTSENLTGFPEDLDFTGLWWIRWNTQGKARQYQKENGGTMFTNFLSAFGEWTYANFMQAEQIVSFAYSNSSSTSYPTIIYQRDALAYQWGYGTTQFAKFLQAIYHWSYGHMTWHFHNASYGKDEVNKFVLIKEDDDQWLRPTIMSEAGLGPGVKSNRPFVAVTYMLTRIENADGSKTKFWSDFEKEGVSRIRLYTTNDYCRRRSLGVYSWIFFFLPTEWFCQPTNYMCENWPMFNSFWTSLR